MAVTDDNGNVVERYNYTPYGEVIDGKYREDIPFLYNGQYGVTTDSNGLYYMRARYYNVEIKRFINQDVLLGVLERVSSLNRYAYVEGNPVSYLDPFGLDRVDTSCLHELLLSFSVAITIMQLAGVPIAYPMSCVISACDLWVNCFDLGQNLATGNFEDAYESVIYIILDLIGVVTSYNLTGIVTGEASKIIIESEKALNDIGNVAAAGSLGAVAIEKIKDVINKIKEWL